MKVKLDATERRVIGSLMEKQLTTPDTYPLTMSSLLAACNQKTNRDPVSDLSEEQVTIALDTLQQRSLAWRVLGGRSVRWDHNADKSWNLDPPAKALTTLLLLRGAQTTGELRNRSERMYRFDSLEELSAVLETLSGQEEPLVSPVPRRPGQKEDRWRTTLGEEADPAIEAGVRAGGSSLSGRLADLEAAVERIERELSNLKSKLGE